MKQQKGAALLIYLLIMTFFIVVLMTATYSRLLLSVKRGQSSVDSLTSDYDGQSEVYDLLARLSGGYITTLPFRLNETKAVGDTKLVIVGSQAGDVQTIAVTASRSFASSKIVATRSVATSSSSQSADILLGLDCTSSMNDRSTTGNGQTRIANLRTAALNFLDSVPKDGRFRVGAFVFGVDAKWLTSSGGLALNLDGNTNFSEVRNALATGFGSDWPSSSACKAIIDSTSIGTAFSFSQNYLKSRVSPSVKQIEIVITDGEPNSRIPDTGCTPSAYCPYDNYCPSPVYGACYASGSICIPAGVEYLGCTVADKTKTFVYNYTDSSGKVYTFNNVGLRDPNVTAYAVTISTSPNGDAANILSTYLGDNYFPASKASDLTNVLSNILTDIITKHETVKVVKVTPGQ